MLLTICDVGQSLDYSARCKKLDIVDHTSIQRVDRAALTLSKTYRLAAVRIKTVRSKR